MGKFSKLSQVLLDRKFLPVYGTTEKVASQQKLVLLGTPFTWDTNNGISVVYDEEGRPWIKRGILDLSQFSDCQTITMGAYVPHSNDGGIFASQVLDQMCSQVSKQDLTEVRRTAGLMLVIEKMMTYVRDINEYMTGYLKVPANERCANEKILKLYELAKRIHYAQEEAELQEALREVTLQKEV